MLGLSIGLTIGAQGGATGPVYDVYVDSVAGSDANSGTSPSAPLQTLAAAQTAALAKGSGVRVALKCGSNWRERLYLSAIDNVTVEAYGTGAPPIVDCAEYPLAASWSKTGGYTNIYQTALVASTNASLQCRYHGRENDISLIVKTTIAAADAAAGSMYVDRTGAHPIVYLHATDSSDPATNGKVYDFAVREDGVNLSDLGVSGSHRAGSVVTGIVSRANLHDNGSILVGSGAKARRCVAAHGTYHSLFIGDGELEDIVCFDKHSVINSGSQLVAYFNANQQHTLSVKRAFMVGVPDAGTYETCEGYFGHCDGGGGFTSILFEGWAALNLSGSIDLANAAAVTLRGGYLKNSAGPLNAAQPTLFECIQANGQFFTSGRWVPANATLRHIASASGPSIGICNNTTIERSTFYNTLGNGRIASQISVSMANNRNVYFATAGNPLVWCTRAGYVGDYNVFYFPIYEPAQRLIFMQDENSTAYYKLPDWQVATGQDAHSVYMTSAQAASFWLGNPANGDFRINPNAQVTGGDGTVYTGTFTDGTPLTYAGCQYRWDWSGNAIVAGAPTAWPNVPDSYTDALTYVADPSAWVF